MVNMGRGWSRSSIWSPIHLSSWVIVSLSKTGLRWRTLTVIAREFSCSLLLWSLITAVLATLLGLHQGQPNHKQVQKVYRPKVE